MLRKRLLRSDGAMDLAREATATATCAVDKAADELAEAQTHASAAERELAACRLAIAEMQQALQRVEHEHKKEKREMALERVRLAAKVAASPTVDARKKPLPQPAENTDGNDLARAAADIGATARRALMDVELSNSATNHLGLRVSDNQSDSAGREYGGDLTKAGVQQAFIRSFNSDLSRLRVGDASSVRATTGSTSTGIDLASQLSSAEISEVDFTVTDTGEIAKVSFDLQYRGSAADVAGSGVARTHGTGVAATVRDVE